MLLGRRVTTSPKTLCSLWIPDVSGAEETGPANVLQDFKLGRWSFEARSRGHSNLLDRATGRLILPRPSWIRCRVPPAGNSHGIFVCIDWATAAYVRSWR